MLSTVPVALRDNRGRARAARLVFLLLAATSVPILVLALTMPAQNEATMTTQTAMLYMGFGLLSLAHLALLAGSYVALIMWLRRAYYNLHQIPGIHPEYSDGWAAGAWFVPFINLVRPYTIVREVWNDTQRAVLGAVAAPDTVLGWWWAAFILKLLVGRIIWAMQRGSNTDDITSTDLLTSALDAGSQLLVSLFTWYIIGRIARFEEQLALHQQVERLGQPAPATLAVAEVAPEQENYGQPEGY